MSFSVFMTSLEPTLSKIPNERKPRHRLASLGNTKEKMFLAFRICARPIFSENGKDIFLWCSALNASGSIAGLQCGLGFAKAIFWGKGFGKTSTDFPPAERGLGNECGWVSLSDFLAMLNFFN